MSESGCSRVRCLRGLTAAVAIFLVLGSATPASAIGYGDLEITLEDSPKRTAVHGYSEIWVKILNRSTTASHEVKLSIPGYGFSSSDYLRSVVRTLIVEPGKTIRTYLSYPERLASSLGSLEIFIDGAEQTNKISITYASSVRSSTAPYGSLPTPLVLYSKQIDTRFPDWMNTAAVGFTTTRTVDYFRSESPSSTWSPNWLGYTRYDGVVVAASELALMPSEVRSAIAQYVECGGALLVLGPNPQLPPRWKPKPLGTQELSACFVGFGRCYHTTQTDLSDWDEDLIRLVETGFSETLRPWQTVRAQGEVNRAFPVVDDIGLPINGLLALMFIFAFAIGPVNLYFLARYRRKLWLFWTVPTVSLFTCVAVFGFTAFREGWVGRSRIEGITILDENSRRASTIGWSAFYTPLLSGGLHFSTDTEIAPQNGEDARATYSRSRNGGGNGLTLDWSNDQHLASGWLTPRVPAHFVVRKSELRRERLTIAKAARPEAVNGLGVDISTLMYVDEAGNLYQAKNIPAGGRIALEPATQANLGTRPLRNLYNGDWAKLISRAESEGPEYLQKRMYLAVLASTPFMDEGMAKGAARKGSSVVFGILKEGGDED